MDFTQRRLTRELKLLQSDPPMGITLQKDSVMVGTTCWIILISGAESTKFAGEEFKLQVKITPRYPFEAPIVTFLDTPPMHPHVYSNGHICLSILTDDWSPALSIESICLSVLSMLSSCTEKGRPPGNDMYVQTCHKDPRKTNWWYHDDKV